MIRFAYLFYMPNSSPPRWTAACAFALAACALSTAIHVGNGSLRFDALPGLFAGVLFSLMGLADLRSSSIERRGQWALWIILVAGILINFAELYTKAPGLYLQTPDLRPYHRGLALAAGLSIAALLTQGRLRTVALVGLLAIYFLLGRWLIHASPDPRIDVVLWHRDAIRTFLSGMNPYGTSHQNVYPDTRWFDPRVVVGNEIRIGLPYPPLSLLIATLGQLIGGDYRYAALAANLITAALMALAGSHRLAMAGAVFFLSLPRRHFVIEEGWTEPYGLMLLAAMVFTAIRRPRLLPLAMGLLLAVKQYYLVAALLAWLLVPDRRRWVALLLRSGLVAIALTLPFVIWNPRAFWNDLVLVQIRQPFRHDALSLLSVLAALGGPVLPSLVGFGVLVLCLVVALRRAPRTPAGFVGSLGASFCGFFAFNKQAFANYYFLVIGALLLAVATWEDRAARVE